MIEFFISLDNQVKLPSCTIRITAVEFPGA